MAQRQRLASLQGADLCVRLGNNHQVIAVGAQADVLFADDDHPCTAHFDFIDAADDEQYSAAIRYENNRELLLDASDSPAVAEIRIRLSFSSLLATYPKIPRIDIFLLNRNDEILHLC
jgi:hypothetical protein